MNDMSTPDTRDTTDRPRPQDEEVPTGLAGVLHFADPDDVGKCWAWFQRAKDEGYHRTGVGGDWRHD